jgi:hypothetical protein
MNLYVWEGVLVDYTAGMMVAVAPTVEDAQALLLAKCPYIPKEDLDVAPKVIDLTDPEPVALLCWGGG